MTDKSELLQTKLQLLLSKVDYKKLSSNEYIPGKFSLEFSNFFKLVDEYADDTPPFHYAMLDKFESNSSLHANLCHRGAAKTTLLGIRLLFWLAIYNKLPNSGHISNAIYISDSIDNGVKTLRKNLQSLYDKSSLLKELLPTFKLTETYLHCVNSSGKSFDAKFFGVLTGIRGTQINNERPYIAIIDDVMGDKNANSQAYRKLVNEVIYAGVIPAMNPSWHRICLLGTPFDYDDIIVKAVSSGEWNCSVFPVAEKFPCDKKDFRSSWPTRFTYDVVQKTYNTMKNTGNIDLFQRELMLRLSAPDAVMVPFSDIVFYDEDTFVSSQCNFVITTDFAFTDRESADASVISVWAVTPHNNLIWVDGSLKKQTMDYNMEDLISFCEEYNPISVGIEVTGQQSAVVSWFRTRMNDIGQWWPIASNQRSFDPGIRHTKEKLARFSEVAPWLRSGKVRFPKNWDDYNVLREGIKQIISTTGQGIVTADDFIDTVSMLTQIKTYAKNDEMTPRIEESSKIVNINNEVYTLPTYNSRMFEPKDSALGSYLV